MMLRYVIHLPVNVPRDQLHAFMEMLKEAADDRQWRDLVLSSGATITDMRRKEQHVAARRAQRAGPKPR